MREAFRSAPIARLFEDKRIDLSVAILFALLVLILRGSAGEGQASVLSVALHGYVEETSASLSSFVRSPHQIADINSLTAADLRAPGQGGDAQPGSSPIELSTIQENSLLAYAPASEDYIETSGFQRSNTVEYTVQPGDLLSFIASDYGVSVNSIMWANNLSDADSLSLGQVLKIPPVSGVIHKIKKGDTVASIAKKYSADEAKIIAFNSLPQDGKLRLDDELIIPDGRPQGSAAQQSTGKSIVTASKPFAYLPDLGSFFILPAAGFNWGKIHGRNGVDVANSCGTAIYAAAEGNVITSDGDGYNYGFGKYIKITHPNGTETLYAHASKLFVNVGDYVTRGQLIASMGTTGRSTGCHLHFEVHGAKNPLTKK